MEFPSVVGLFISHIIDVTTNPVISVPLWIDNMEIKLSREKFNAYILTLPFHTHASPCTSYTFGKYHLITYWTYSLCHPYLKGVVNCQNSRDKGPPEGNSAEALFHNNTKYAFHIQSLNKSQVLKSQQVHIYLSDICELIIQSPWPLPQLGRWLANKLTITAGMLKLLDTQ